MREIVKKMPLREILAMETGYVDSWDSSAQQSVEWERFYVFFSDGTYDKLPYSREYRGFADRSIRDTNNNFGYRVYDFTKKRINEIERIEISRKRYVDGEAEYEERYIIYPEEKILNIKEIKKRIIEKVESSKEEEVLFYYFKVFSDYSDYSDSSE
jgi:hypothetical protein